jgi:integrase
MEYPATTLSRAKGKWYVCCTVPIDLRQAFKNQKQVKRSSGTSDQSIAKRKQHAITTQIYSEFDEARASLTTPSAIVRKAIEAAITYFQYSMDKWDDQQPPELNLAKFGEEYGMSVGSIVGLTWPQLGPEILEHLYKTVADTDVSDLWHKQQYINSPAWDKVLRDGGFEPAPVSVAVGVTISGLQQEYIEKSRWNREATNKQFKLAIDDLREFVGDIPVSEITAHHGYDWAQKLSEGGSANRTISGRITACRSMFEYGIRTKNLLENPFSGLRLSTYGRKSESYLPLEKDELHRLFQQSMKDQERLALTLLLTTGMRLDEVALLRGDMIKFHEAGFRYADLRVAVTKNEGSNRLVALHPDVQLPQTQGRLFTYATNADGKAWVSAGNAIGPLVKAVVDNKRKVVHSLRGTLKDLLRDADVSKEVNDFITGHGQGDVASKYGSGPSTEVRYQAIASVKHPWLS